MKKIAVCLGLVSFFLIGLFAGILPAWGRQLQGIPYSEQLMQNITFSDTSGHWAELPIKKMAALSVIRGYGSKFFHPEAPVSRQEGLAMILRLMGKEKEAQGAASSSGGSAPAAGTGQPSSPAGVKANPWAEGYLQVAADLELISQDDLQQKDWQGQAERQEIAFWLARALNLSPAFGAERQAIYNFKDWRDFNPDYVSLVEGILRDKIMTGVTPDTFKPKKTATRAEMAAILERCLPRFSQGNGMSFFAGEVISIAETETNLGGTKINRRNFQILSSTGELLELESSSSFDTSQPGKRDFIVAKQGRLGTSELLAEGDRVSLVVNSQGEGVFVEAAPGVKDIVSGLIDRIDSHKGQITILDDDYKSLTYSIAPGAEVVIDRRPAALENLQYGQEVSLSLSNGLVMAVSSQSFPDKPGYIAPGGRVKNGVIRYLDDDELVLLTGDGREETYEISSATEIIRESRPITLARLKAGDQVKLYFNDLETVTVDKILVAGQAQLLDRVVKGRLDRVIPKQDLIMLSQTKEYHPNGWREYSSNLSLTVAPGAEIFRDGRKVELDQLQQAIGEDIYLAVKNSFGRKQAVKLNVKGGAEHRYFDRIDNLDWAAGGLSLEDHDIAFGDETIIIKDGRLIDGYGLEKGEEAVAVTNSLGRQEVAMVISIEKGTVPPVELFRGRINKVRLDEVEFNRYSELVDNQWEEEYYWDNYIDFDYSDDTVILDSEHDRIVPIDEFRESAYSRDFNGRRAYLVVQDDGIIGLALWDSFSYYERVSAGKLTGIDGETEWITLDDGKNWSALHDSWQIDPYFDELNLSKALIIKNGEAVDISELSPGDQLYIVRDNIDAIIIVVQD